MVDVGREGGAGEVGRAQPAEGGGRMGREASKGKKGGRKTFSCHRESTVGGKRKLGESLGRIVKAGERRAGRVETEGSGSRLGKRGE